jgi:hypothetical protein
MSTRRARIIWDGPAEDVIWLLIDPPPDFWQVEPVAGSSGVSLLRILDEREMATDSFAGVEIVDFLRFEAWETLPDAPEHWQVGDDEPGSLAAVLRRAQATLRSQSLPGLADATGRANESR